MDLRWWRSPRAGSGWAGTHGHPGERPRHRVWLDRLRHRPVARDQSRVRADSSRTTGAAPPAVVGGSALRRAGAARGRRELVRRDALLRLAVGARRPRGIGFRPRPSGRRRRAAASTDARFPWGEDRPAAARLRAAAAVRPTRPPTRSACSRSRASATSGVSTGRTRPTTRGRPSANPRGPETAPAGCPAAARGAIRTRGARWRTARPCPRRCATPTTASAWCATARLASY